MSRFKIVLLALNVLLLAFLFRDRIDLPKGPSCKASPYPMVRIDRPPVRSVLDVAPHEMRSIIRDPYRLKPDRRFLLAVRDVAILTGNADVDAVLDVERRGERWHFSIDGGELGSLKEEPTFGEAIQLLEEYARGSGVRARARGRVVPVASVERWLREIESADVSRVVLALEEIDATWNEASWAEDLLEVAVRGLVNLNALTFDELELGDAIGARALAALAIARAVSPGAFDREEALLAHALGYRTHAEQIARRFDRDDPAAAFILDRTDLLRDIAESAGVSPMVRYRYLQTLAERRNQEAWSAWVAEHGPKPTLGSATVGTGVLVGRFDLTRNVSAVYPYIVFFELVETLDPGTLDDAGTSNFARSEIDLERAIDVTRDDLGGHIGALLAAFEDALEGERTRFSGPFVDRDVLRASYAAPIYGAVYRRIMHHLYGVASPGRSRATIRSIGDGPDGVRVELVRWASHLADATGGDIDVETLAADIEDFRCLGAQPLFWTFREMLKETQRPEVMHEAAKYFARHLDSRPGHRWRLGAIAFGALWDLPLAERQFEGVLDVAARDEPSTAAWAAFFVGDSARLIEMATDTMAPPHDRAEALEMLVKQQPDERELIVSVGEALIDLDPDSWEIRKVLLDYLEERGEYEAGLPVINAWLERNDRDAGFPYIFARTALARFEQGAGRPERGYAAVKSVVDSWQAGAIGRAALILQELGRSDEADVLARRLTGRYPSVPWARATAAEIQWMQGDFDAAADALDSRRFPQMAWRREIWDSFSRVFSDRPRDDAVRAFEALIAEGIPTWVLEGIPTEAYEAGHVELAFDLQSRLEVERGVFGSMRFPLRAYRYLSELEGNDTALEWVRPRIPDQARNQASIIMVQERTDDLLWSLIPDPSEGYFPPGVWQMRAAAFARSGELSPDRREALFAYFDRPPDNDYEAMGRYLIGLDSEETLLSRATTDQRRCEIAYYIGLKAQAAGRLEEALEWYRVVMETGRTTDYEYAWALEQLSNWWTENRRLEVAAASR